jgi:hypothetical protein
MILLELFNNISDYSGTPVNFSESLLESLFYLEYEESGLVLKQIIEESYTDGIDGFENVENDGTTISGIFFDKVSSGLTKRYQFEVTEDQVSYKLLNPEDLDGADFDELEFAATTETKTQPKKKNCVKGTSCGGTCINKDKKCSSENSSASKKKVKGLLEKPSKVPKQPKGSVKKVQDKVAKPPKQPKNTKVAKNDKNTIEDKQKRIEDSNKRTTVTPKKEKDVVKEAVAKDSDFTEIQNSGINIPGIKLVQDKNGTQYFRKRAGSMTGDSTYDGASDVVGSAILRQLGLPAPVIKFDGDRMFSSKIEGVDIHKQLPKELKGKVSDDFNENGLLLDVEGSLKNSLAHPDLAKIFAADIFTGNADRHGGNLIRTPDGRYAPIDNEGSFYIKDTRDYSGIIESRRYKTVSDDIDKLDIESLTKDQVTNLKTVRETLKDLLDNQNPDKILNDFRRLHDLAPKDAPVPQDMEEQRIEAVKENFKDVKSLYDKLNKKLGDK